MMIDLGDKPDMLQTPGNGSKWLFIYRSRLDGEPWRETNKQGKRAMSGDKEETRTASKTTRGPLEQDILLHGVPSYLYHL